MSTTNLKSFLTALVALLMMSNAYSASVNGIFYNLDMEKKQAEVAPCGFSGGYKGNITIPESITYNNIVYEVVAITKEAFRDNRNLTGVNLPASIQRIGDGAFLQCEQLTSIHLPEGLTNIGDEVFRGCTRLTTVNIPKDVTRIGASAFAFCSKLTSIDIPSKVRSIGELAFIGCESMVKASYASIEQLCSISNDGRWASPLSNAHHLYIDGRLVTEVVIPDGITAIGDYAFCDCWDIITVRIPASVKNIGSYAFICCTSLIDVALPSSLDRVSEWLFAGCSSLPTITLPESVKIIGDAAFSRCTNLSSMILPEELDSIGSIAFSGCTSLASLSLPESNTKIGEQTFEGCTALTSMTFPQGVTEVGSYMFTGCTKLEKVELPEGLTHLGGGVFYNCASLTSLTIPSGVMALENNLCKGCTGLTDLVINGAVTCWGTDVFPTNTLKRVTINGNVAEAPFAGMSSIEEANVGGDASIVSDNLFAGCPKLHKATLGSSVKYVKNGAFEGCARLDTIYCESMNVPYCYPKAFSEDMTGCTLVVHDDLIQQYSEAQGWKQFGHILGDMHVLTYILNGETYKEIHLRTGERVTAEQDLSMEGYTFSGWGDQPKTMPAEDVTLTATLLVNSYTLTYLVDGEEYKTVTIEYGSAITPEDMPERDGYTFSGWKDLPETMPAKDVTVTGSYTVNEYWVTYIVDGVTYTSEKVAFGSVIVPPIVPEKEGYDFSWTYIPETMPAKDIMVYGTYTVGVWNIADTEEPVSIYTQDGRQTESLQRGVNIVRMKNGTIKKIMVR